MQQSFNIVSHCTSIASSTAPTSSTSACSARTFSSLLAQPVQHATIASLSGVVSADKTRTGSILELGWFCRSAGAEASTSSRRASAFARRRRAAPRGQEEGKTTVQRRSRSGHLKRGRHRRCWLSSISEPVISWRRPCRRFGKKQCLATATIPMTIRWCTS